MRDLDTWFVQEVLPHEAALERYIRRFAAHEVADVRQEIYARAYEAARKQLPEQARPFLFSIARNLLIDRERRRRVVSIDSVAEIDSLFVECDAPLADRIVAGRQELNRLTYALESLPIRCRQVVALRKIEGLSPVDVSRRLGITVSTVDKHLSKGVRLLATFLNRDDTSGSSVVPFQKRSRP